MAAKRGESKQGLIITLVFFVLTTIGLGIAAYFGFAEQDNLGKKVADALKDKKAAEGDRDFWKFQAMYLKAATGHLPPKDQEQFNVLRGQYDGGKGQLGKGSDTERAAFDTLVNETLKGKPLFWDPRQAKPQHPYEALVKQLETKNAELKKQTDQAVAKKDQAEKEAKGAKDLLEEAKAAQKKALEDLEKKYAAEQKKTEQQLADLRDETAKLGTDKEVLTRKIEDDKKLFDSEGKKKDALLRQQRDLTAQRVEEINQLKQRGSDAPKDWRTDWKVVYLDRTGTQPYINLGYADQLKEQVTFSVHGVGPDGKPISSPKASIEVINILGEHLAQARITGIKDASKDPVLKGDILFNATWNPTLKKHVAIAGLIDLTGEGKDNLPELMRNLERQNVVIDAYQDIKDFTVKGPGITVHTDYLIVGEGLDYNPDVVRERDKDFRAKVEKGITDMEKQASANGVTVIGLRKYLEMIGYRLPKATIETQRSTGFRVPVAGSTPAEGGEPKEQPKKEDKPKKDDKPMADKP